MSDPHGRFLNRELSWLDFNRRVLALSEEPGRPLLERAKFLAIFSRNLDEFFAVRVASLQDQVAAQTRISSPDGRSPAEQLAEIRARVEEHSAFAQELFAREIRPALAEAGIELATWSDLGDDERIALEERLDAELLPLLVPLSVDSAHPFPYISNLSLNVGALLRGSSGEARFARVKLPPFVDRLWRVGEDRFVPVEQIIIGKLDRLFPGDEIVHAGCFRVTRDADLELRESESVDLVTDIEAGLRRRLRGSDAVRLEASVDLDAEIRQLLMDELRLESDELYETRGMLDLGALWELQRLDRPDLADVPFAPRPVAGLPATGAGPAAHFAALRASDFLVHHPYESFEASVEGFLRAAADDPDVRVLMSTIYRTGGPESGIVKALTRAAARGKQVVVLVELKARFDEASNLERARDLERAGAHVVYGVLGLKTHAKVALAVRQEPDGLRRYCHLGTGNYNPVTARLYEDLGLLTANPEITEDVATLFHRLTSGSEGHHYERLLVAPESLRPGILARIERESEAEDGRIVMKLNSLSDPELIDALYAASQSGVEIDLVVRGICCLRPGVEGLSERIRVRSILGRFLEHSRILRFGSAERGYEYWTGSADLMPRNLDQRVEALAPIDDPALQARLEGILQRTLDPTTAAWELGPDAAWKRTAGSVDLQQLLLQG